MFESTPRMTTGMLRGQSQNQQPRRLMLALALLLMALVALLIKDRQFWFGSEQATIDADVPVAATSSQAVAKAHPVQNAARKQAHVVRTSVETSTPAQPTDDSGVAVTRTVLPPLDVEVVAGDKHNRLHPGSNSTRVEIPNNDAQTFTTTNAAEREPLATAVQPSAYPLLAQHMNVQGSVVLQAIISAEGTVQDLRVLSGPSILTSAAQQAVREWRFKPVIQNGQAVETKAKITVNFSIKVADNSASTTLADSRSSDVLVVSR